jgi:6-phosphofructokinase 1
VGVKDLHQDVVIMDHDSVNGLMACGGIILGSSRCPEFQAKETRNDVGKLLTEVLKVAAVVVVGGEGSMRGAADLARESGLTVVGIPATIDNDYGLTMESLGFDTAVTTIVDSVRHVNDTARSHHRIMVLETMGRESGQLAQTAALASGAEIVVTPEPSPLNQVRLQEIAERIEFTLNRGRSHAIVLITEGVATDPPDPAGPSKALANSLQRHFDHVAIQGAIRHVDVRHTVLGHLQRGGSPSVSDQKLGANFAEAAAEVVASGGQSGVLGVVRGQIEFQSFDAPPLQDREREIQRIYELQKDVSDYREPEPESVSINERPGLRRTRKDRREKYTARDR